MGLESQSLANLGIDAAFIQSPQHRPNAKHCDFTLDDQIPLIDLSPLNSTTPPHPSTFDSLVAQIHAACRDWGFLQVINHGISPQLLHTVQSEAANFFALPLQEKAKVRRDFENPLGYYDTELTKNVRDWKEIFDFACRGTIRLPSSFELESDETRTVTNQWPQNPPGLREACEKYAEAVEKLAFRLMELISRSLGLPADYFNSKFEDPTSLLRLNHCSPCPMPELALGVGRHKDGGALTVLAQDDVGGLQVERKDGEWIGVKPIPNSFVINVGDCMQIPFPVRISNVPLNLKKDPTEDDCKVIARSSSLTNYKTVAADLAKRFNRSSKKTRYVMLYVQNWLILYIYLDLFCHQYAFVRHLHVVEISFF